MAAENKGIYFTELTLKNVRCFGDEAVLKLSNDKGEWTRWNVILGDNGTGKTTLLQCLANFTYAIFEGTKFYVNIIDFQRYIISNRNSTNKNYNGKIIASSYNSNIDKNEILETSLSCLYNERTGIYTIAETHENHNYNRKNLFIVGYGANRHIDINTAIERKAFDEISATLFSDDAKLINTEEWLLQIDYAASRDSEIKTQAINRRDLVIESLKGILPDIKEIVLQPPMTLGQLVPRIQFHTSYGWVSIHQLSYGYKTMVAWMVDLAARMFNRYPDSDNPLEEPVIILVDEIDLHLHPKWQRQIFEFLEKRFPKAQFIVTAHSPLIVQSAPKDANIIVLKKEQVGDEFVVRIDNDTKSVWNWRIDQIMASDLFGLEGLRNPGVEKLMQERTGLLKRNDLNEDEKKRLEELNEISYSLPTADNPDDIEAMEIIRKSAAYLKNKQKSA